MDNNNIEFREVPNFGDLMDLDEWDCCITCDAIIASDGTGYYSTDDKVSNISAFSGKVPAWATHVMWFNN
tara:strand:- start:77 stop:286 length:210 start_codon:yes stop_codon:yes gene_type:complete